MMRLMLLAGFFMAAACAETAADPITQDPVQIDENFPPAVRELIIDVDGVKMNGHIYLANGEGPHPTAVMLHGFPGNEKNLDIAQALRRAGWNTLFFHYRGAWGSGGDFRFSGAVDDVATILSYLRDEENSELRVDPDHLVLIGHSMGGFMALRAGANDPAIGCVVAMAPANLGEIAAAAAGDEAVAQGVQQYVESQPMIAGAGGGAIAEDLISNAEAFELKNLAPEYRGRKLLLFGAERDQAVDITVVERIAAAYEADEDVDVTMVRLDADHSFSWHRMSLTRTINNWLLQNCL